MGFADIVGYTRQSRSVSPDELARMLETFESIATTIVTDHDGRVIKTIGDEILFVADDPRAMARIALDLVEVPDADFPELRVGAAYGAVLSKLGDVFGSMVNIASRLTSLTPPGEDPDRPRAERGARRRRRVPGAAQPQQGRPRLQPARDLDAEAAARRGRRSRPGGRAVARAVGRRRLRGSRARGSALA